MASDVTPIRLLLTPNEVAERLSLSRSMIYELIRSGELQSVKIGRARRVPLEAIDRYIRGLFPDPDDFDGAPIPNDARLAAS